MSDESKTPTEVSREELHSLVWSEPLTKLALRYDLTGTGLSKICKRHRIPTPGRGYWQKLRHGKRVRRTPLRPLPEGKGDRPIRLGKPTPRTAAPEQLEDMSGPVADQRRFESREENRIMVKDHLRGSHPLIRQTRDAWKAGRSRNSHTRRDRSRPILDIKVSRSSERRALLIMNALLKALEDRGFPVRIAEQRGENPTVATVHGEDVAFCMEERRKRVERTAEEMGRTVFSWDKDRTFYDLEYTGRLTLKITTWQARGGRRSWTDGKVQRVENCLNDFVVAVVATGEKVKAWRQQREEEARRRERARRERLEQERREQLERERIEELRRQVVAWEWSRRISQYLNALDDPLQHGRPPSGPELTPMEWRKWCEKYAKDAAPFSQSSPNS